MARFHVAALVMALCLSAAAADWASDFTSGANGVVDGALALADGGYLSKDATKLVKETGALTKNQTAVLATQYEEANGKELKLTAITVDEGEVGGLKAMAEGGALVDAATAEVEGLPEKEFKKATNTTYFWTMQKVNDNVVLISKAVEDSYGAGSASAESTGNRKLLATTVDCGSATTDAELQACYLSAVSSTTSSLSANTGSVYQRQYDYYCKPIIRSTYSDDLEDDFSDDKTMKTCNDFSVFGVFGAGGARCSECISHFSEREGGLLTQEDCDLISADEQKWFLDEMDGKFMMRNEEEDDHCVTAPSTSSIYSSALYTMQRCSSSSKAQMFEVLELDTWTSDPRIVMRLAGTSVNGSPGLCLTTAENDDDDGIGFISAPCVCAKAQIISRDD